MSRLSSTSSQLDMQNICVLVISPPSLFGFGSRKLHSDLREPLTKKMTRYEKATDVSSISDSIVFLFRFKVVFRGVQIL